MNADIQTFYHKLKEIQRNQPPAAPAAPPAEKAKSSFSIDSLAKSSKTEPQINSFNAQHQELYRKALENLHNVQRLQQHVPSHGYHRI